MLAKCRNCRFFGKSPVSNVKRCRKKGGFGDRESFCVMWELSPKYKMNPLEGMCLVQEAEYRKEQICKHFVEERETVKIKRPIQINRFKKKR